jgi:carbonic anhydrase
MDRFLLLLDDLGGLIGIPFHVNSKGLCQLNINNQLHIQISDEKEKDRILIATFICEIPPGKFKENIFSEALKENHSYPRLATFAYSEKNNQLAVFSHVYYPNLTGDSLADFLEKFIEKALSWKTGVETGHLPKLGEHIHKVGPSIFDIKTQ